MGRSVEEIRNDITNGGTSLGIEFGSTRIKAVLVDSTTAPVAQGSYEWENRLENGIWTYSLEDIWKGLRSCYQDLAADVKKQYGARRLHRSMLQPLFQEMAPESRMQLLPEVSALVFLPSLLPHH